MLAAMADIEVSPMQTLSHKIMASALICPCTQVWLERWCALHVMHACILPPLPVASLLAGCFWRQVPVAAQIVERGCALLGYAPIGNIGMLLLATGLRTAALLPGGHAGRLVTESRWLQLPLEVGQCPSEPH